MRDTTTPQKACLARFGIGYRLMINRLKMRNKRGDRIEKNFKLCRLKMEHGQLDNFSNARTQRIP